MDFANINILGMIFNVDGSSRPLSPRDIDHLSSASGGHEGACWKLLHSTKIDFKVLSFDGEVEYLIDESASTSKNKSGNSAFPALCGPVVARLQSSANLGTIANALDHPDKVVEVVHDVLANGLNSHLQMGQYKVKYLKGGRTVTKAVWASNASYAVENEAYRGVCNTKVHYESSETYDLRKDARPWYSPEFITKLHLRYHDEKVEWCKPLDDPAGWGEVQYTAFVENLPAATARRVPATATVNVAMHIESGVTVAI